MYSSVNKFCKVCEWQKMIVKFCGQPNISVFIYDTTFRNLCCGFIIFIYTIYVSHKEKNVAEKGSKCDFH